MGFGDEDLGKRAAAFGQRLGARGRDRWKCLCPGTDGAGGKEKEGIGTVLPRTTLGPPRMPKARREKRKKGCSFPCLLFPGQLIAADRHGIVFNESEDNRIKFKNMGRREDGEKKSLADIGLMSDYHYPSINLQRKKFSLPSHHSIPPAQFKTSIQTTRSAGRAKRDVLIYKP